MKRKNPHAVALGRKGGSATTIAKAKAARSNGKKGGRPRSKKESFSALPVGMQAPSGHAKRDRDILP